MHNGLFKVFAGLAVVLVMATACGGDDDPGTSPATGNGTGAADPCAEDEFGCVEIGAGEPINIGTLLAISGDVATLGQDSQDGAALAIDFLDDALDGTDGQLLGHEVALVNRDDGCSAEGGQAGATELAADESIVAVIGTSCSSSALGVADGILSDAGILLISPSNTNPNLTAEGTHEPFYLRTAHNDKIQGAVVADFVVQELQEGSAGSAATIHDESPYADALAAVFRDNFETQGGEIVGDEAITSTDTDMGPVLTTIAESSPDVLYQPNFNPACGLIVQQAQGVSGLEDTTIIGSDGCLAPEYLSVAGDAADGTFVSGPDLSGFTQGDFYTGELLPAYEEKTGGAPTASFHAHAFDAMNILFAAIESVAVEGEDGSLQIPRTALKDAVYATSGYEGVIGTITCTPLGDCATEVTIAVYAAPNLPIEGGEGDGAPVFSETKTLEDVGG